MASPRASLGLALNNVARAPGSSQARTRVGRGIGSRIGKTGGRGHKGQLSRKGATRMFGFEGGQMPFWIKQPKSGFSNAATELDFQVVNVGDVQRKVKLGHLPASNITVRDLVKAGLVRAPLGAGVKLLGDGAVTVPLSIEVNRASQAAIQAVERAGGTVVTTWMGRLGLRAHVKPHKFDVLPAPPLPKPKQMPYYTSDANRGYLSPLVQLQRLNRVHKSSS